MKKVTIFFISLFLVSAAFAQPVLNNSLNLVIGDSYKNNIVDEVNNIDPGESGANVEWDFETITGGMYIEGDLALCVAPSTTYFADSAAVADANICVRDATNPDLSIYQYLKCDNSSQNMLALGFYNNGDVTFSTYVDPLKTLEFPFTYGDSFEDSYDLYMSSGEMGSYLSRDSASVVVVADAYGTITTPTGTFENVLRYVRTTMSQMWYNFEGNWIPAGTSTFTQYIWYATDIKVPVMTLTEVEGYEDYSATYMVEYHSSTGIGDHQNEQLNVFPNPATDQMTITAEKNISHLNLYTIDGRCTGILNTETFLPGHTTINLQQYPKGVYLVEVEFEDGTFLREKVIKE